MRWRSAPWGDCGDTGEELRDRLATETASDEDQPRAAVAVRPVFEFDRWVGDMLDEMDDDRPPAFLDSDKAFDAEKIGSA
jgi:hypothetical protein